MRGTHSGAAAFFTKETLLLVLLPVTEAVHIPVADDLRGFAVGASRHVAVADLGDWFKWHKSLHSFSHVIVPLWFFYYV